MTLDFSSLEKALAALERGLTRALANPADEELRDAVIQRFEFSMDLCWKMLQRWLKQAGVPDSTFRTKRDLFREGARLALLEDPTAWFGFYEARNETSHTYNQAVAQRVFLQAEPFLKAACLLLDHLKRS